MNRYIDADKLEKKFNEILDNPKEYDKPIHDMMLEFYFAPTLDVVEVVRCKDCKWWTKQEDSLQGKCSLMQSYPTGMWFCANGEKK